MAKIAGQLPGIMQTVRDAARVQLSYWGTRLNVLAALVVAYMAANGAAIEQAVNSVVPERYQPIASVLVGLVSFLIVNAAANSDVRKAASNG